MHEHANQQSQPLRANALYVNQASKFWNTDLSVFYLHIKVFVHRAFDNGNKHSHKQLKIYKNDKIMHAMLKSQNRLPHSINVGS